MHAKVQPPVKITKIEAFQVDLPLHEGSYKFAGGKSVEVFDSTVVAVHTDAGVTGQARSAFLFESENRVAGVERTAEDGEQLGGDHAGSGGRASGPRAPSRLR